MESDNPNVDLRKFGQDTQVESRRQALAADIKFLITKGNLYSGIKGIAIERAESAQLAYGLCKNQFAFGNGEHSFAHEVGHIFGAQHDRESSLPPSPFDLDPYPHGFKKPVTYNYGLFNWGIKRKLIATIMVEGRQAEGSDFNSGGHNFTWENILYFSNPNVSVYNQPIGRTDNANNSRKIREVIPLIRSFTIVPDEFRISI